MPTAILQCARSLSFSRTFYGAGNGPTKRSADNFNAFKSNNYPELAKIGLGIHFNHNALSKTSLNKPLHPRYNLDTSVMSIDLFPGLNKHVLRHQLSTPGIKGVVLRTYGAGNGPTKSWFIDAVRDAISRGIIILNVTQCVNGAVHSNRYMGGDYLSTAGVVSGHDLTFEAAITKMMFLFGLGLGHDEVVRRLTEPIAGELTLNHAK